MKLTLLTCTGGRPEAFALCEKWMARQALKWDQWIVVDDGNAPTKTTMGQKVLRRLPEPDDPDHTLIVNLRLGLGAVTGDAVLCVEDDDWYRYDYTMRMEQELEKAGLVGESQALYYHVGINHWHVHTNTEHASLCSTGFRSSLIPFILPLLNDRDQFLDLHLWRLPVHKRLFLDAEDKRICVGIKGMPGREGIGKGHVPIYGPYKPDENGSVLRKFIGDDADEYVKFRW